MDFLTLYGIGGLFYLVLVLPSFSKYRYLEKRKILISELANVTLSALIWPLAALAIWGIYEAQKILLADRIKKKQIRAYNAAVKTMFAAPSTPPYDPKDSPLYKSLNSEKKSSKRKESPK